MKKNVLLLILICISINLHSQIIKERNIILEQLSSNYYFLADSIRYEITPVDSLFDNSITAYLKDKEKSETVYSVDTLYLERITISSVEQISNDLSIATSTFFNAEKIFEDLLDLNQEMIQKTGEGIVEKSIEVHGQKFVGDWNAKIRGNSEINGTITISEDGTFLLFETQQGNNSYELWLFGEDLIYIPELTNNVDLWVFKDQNMNFQYFRSIEISNNATNRIELYRVE